MLLTGGCSTCAFYANNDLAAVTKLGGRDLAPLHPNSHYYGLQPGDLK